MCGKDCDHQRKCNTEDYFHRLTKIITHLEIKRSVLAAKNNKCGQKMCSICKCPNGKYEYLSDSNEKSNLCKYCIKKIIRTKNPVKSINEYECPVCGGTDGKYIIKSITPSLCEDCYVGINDKFNK
jgi:hypothetical protein